MAIIRYTIVYTQEKVIKYKVGFTEWLKAQTYFSYLCLQLTFTITEGVLS